MLCLNYFLDKIIQVCWSSHCAYYIYSAKFLLILTQFLDFSAFKGEKSMPFLPINQVCLVIFPISTHLVSCCMFSKGQPGGCLSWGFASIHREFKRCLLHSLGIGGLQWLCRLIILFWGISCLSRIRFTARFHSKLFKSSQPFR